jgi:hypothetical protein
MVETADVMTDLETTGTSAGCCILSIGACTFSEELNFYQKIWHQSCLESGLVDNRETIAWWSRQSVEARQEAFSGTSHLVTVLGAFSDFLRSIPAKQVFVWGNGADFDLPILAAAYHKLGMNVPWKPYNGRCYRTLKNLYRDIDMPAFEGMKHNALHDAKMQARHARLILHKHFNK